MVSEYTNGDKFPTSKYTLLKAEDFATISNLKFDVIVDELVQINNPGHISRATFTLLKMFKAYDITKNQMLLDSAIRLADWLKQVDKTDVSLINLLQGYYRKRELNEDEENVLEDMIARNRGNRQICAAAYILLGNSKRARSIIDTLPDKQKKSLRSIRFIPFILQKATDEGKYLLLAQTKYVLSKLYLLYII